MLRAFLGAMLLLQVPAQTQADEIVRIAPAASGFLSQFRLLERSRRAPDSPPETVDCPQCPTVGTASEIVDLRAVAGRRNDFVDLGWRVHAPRDGIQRMLIGTRGTVEVWLDGQLVQRIERARRRADDQLVRMNLPAGDHHLVFRCASPESGSWTLSIRMINGRYRPGVGYLVVDVGAISDEQATKLAHDSVAVREDHILSETRPIARLTIARPGGGPRTPLPIQVDETTFDLGPVRGIYDAPRTFDVPIPRRGLLPTRVVVGTEVRRVGRELALNRPLLAAMAEVAELELPESARGPMRWRYEEMERCIREQESDREWRRWLSTDSRRLSRLIRQGRNPFETVRGYQRMAHISDLDGSAQPYELFVPAGRRRNWPLLVTLHGFKGNAGDYFRNTFGLPRDYETNESLVHHGRHGEPPQAGPMVVIAPQGRGQTMYRHAGEIDILEAIADVRQRVNIDPRRIYITGGSMGGTGSAYLPFRHPDLFAAAAALAGYHDQRVRQDTHHEGLSQTERFLQAFRSDVDWTENALHLPMLLVRGTRDRPLAWTRRQVARLRELGYEHEHREPVLGHNVWTDTYHEGAIFEWMNQHRRPAAPRRVRLRTARERTHTAWWVTIDARSSATEFASVDARSASDEIEASIDGADGVTFRSPPGHNGGALTVRIGEQSLSGPAPLSIRRTTRGWEAGGVAQTGRKRAGVSGPIRDVFHEPLTFVVGTLDPNHTAINRMVAEHWAHPKGWDVRYPIVDDTAVTEEMVAERTLVLIGPPCSNRLHARYSERLPLQYGVTHLTLNGQRYTSEQVGAALVYPNPDNPDRSLLIIAGASPRGTWRSMSLPDVLPDYVVFDEHIAAARNQWSCGGARVDDGSENGGVPTSCHYLAQGFFDMHWRSRPE